jgi:hypothetical protein
MKATKRATPATFTRRTLAALGVAGLGPALLRCDDGESPPPAGQAPLFPPYEPPAIDPPRTSNLGSVGALGDPDVEGIRVPAGFTARIVARSGELVEGTDYVWHAAPDGGATFLAPDGGWVYVSNSEVLVGGEDGLHGGGVGAMRFDKDGAIVSAYRILSGTAINCAGGPTPWGTWLSCEEHSTGKVWECDPFGAAPAIPWPALGVFKHEAIAIDLAAGHAYLTEDEEDGRFYRFVSAGASGGRLDFSAGKLQVMQVAGGEVGAVTWLDVPDSSATQAPTRSQLPESTAFDGGEGIWLHEGIVYFSTKGNGRVWAYDTEREELSIFYDDDLTDEPLLTGVDNITITAAGDVLVAEDGGDMQIVAITPAGDLVPLVQIVGQPESEITGPALDPYRRRLYFSSQRGVSGEIFGDGGITYEITGPFFV